MHNGFGNRHNICANQQGWRATLHNHRAKLHKLCANASRRTRHCCTPRAPVWINPYAQFHIERSIAEQLTRRRAKLMRHCCTTAVPNDTATAPQLHHRCGKVRRTANVVFGAFAVYARVACGPRVVRCVDHATWPSAGSIIISQCDLFHQARVVLGLTPGRRDAPSMIQAIAPGSHH